MRGLISNRIVATQIEIDCSGPVERQLPVSLIWNLAH
jgi:hypothetical protein